MRITPLDIRKQEFRRSMRGLDSDEVYAFLATIADEYETILTDNKALKDRLLELDDKVQEYRNMEKTLRNTLLTAERVNVEAKENARREAGLIIKEAEMEADKAFKNIKDEAMELRNIIQDLKREKESYLSRLKMLAESHLKFIENAENDFKTDDLAVDKMLNKAEKKSSTYKSASMEKKFSSAGNKTAGPAIKPDLSAEKTAENVPRDGSIPDLNDVLDKMAENQKEAIHPSKSVGPADNHWHPSPYARQNNSEGQTAREKPLPSKNTAESKPDESARKTVAEKDFQKPPPAPKVEAAQEDKPMAKVPAAKNPAPEKPAGGKPREAQTEKATVQAVSKGETLAETNAQDDEWSLERLKRDILSGDSKGNEDD